jgi:hypothetical protein
MRSTGRIRTTTSEENFWPSFTDMISTIAIILFFLIPDSHVKCSNQ